MRGVIYARYSPGPRQTDQSIEGQVADCQQFADENGIDIIEIYADRHVSGKSVVGRDEFQRMLRDAEKGRFDCVLVWKIDRFGRDRQDIALGKMTLKRAGVKLMYARESVPDGPEGIILESVLEGLAEYYSADLRQKVIRGMRETAKKGQYCGQPLPIGYKVDAERHIIVDKREAAAVREAFRMHNSGAQMKEIVQMFADRGIEGKRGKLVSNAVVYRMLRNRKYLGEFSIQDVQLEVEPIIDQATFLEAARHFKTSRNNAAGKAKVNYLLSCKMFCGYCGSLINAETGTGKLGKVYRYYKCGDKKRGKACELKPFPKDHLEDAIILATGARENFIPFEGWTLPGVMGAGAAQTMVNLHGVQPGSRVLMVGTGNVGLVVSYQLMQAGIQVEALIDAAPRVGGYGVHAAKLARLGVPFYLSHTIVKAEGTDKVTGAVIAQVDEKFQPIPGTEKHFDVDTICMAVGLSPMSELPAMAGCQMEDKGGAVPKVDACGETSIPGIFAAGDAAGIEEASSAMITGKLAGIAATRRLGYVGEEMFEAETDRLRASLQKLHEGMFSPQNRGRNDFTETDEGYPISQSLLHKGYMEDQEITRYPGAVSGKSGVHPVIECSQNIPCDPCQDACKFGCIRVGDEITRLPCVNEEAKCTGCGLCVASCSGQAIFLVDETYDEGHAAVTLPYEFLPYPQAGDKGVALGRDGREVCEAEVVSLKINKAMDQTALLTMKVPREMAMTARFFKKKEA